ncbi:MAG: AAA family ATPase [Deltaproteobacteria bacterium]|nr:AAA family ATPase [Deltaproteobacteria bacterium]
MLRELHIQTFKAFDDARFKLSPLTVLAGPNGSGKSTVLHAIAILGDLVQGTITSCLETHGWEYDDLPHLRSRASRMGLTGLHDLPEIGEVEWSVTLGARRFPGVAAEHVRRRASAVSPWLDVLQRNGRNMRRRDELVGAEESIKQTLPASWLSAVAREDADRFPTLVALAGWARGVREYLFLDPLKLRAPARGDGASLGKHGEELAPFLRRLKERTPGAFTRLVDRVRRHYPRLETLSPKREQFGWTRLDVRERWNGEVADFNARQVSDGLLRLIAFAALFELPAPPSVVLIDELENGLHPRLLGSVVSMLEELASTGTQVIATTHSPITLSYMRQAESVLLVTRGRAGGVRVTPLTETRGFARLRNHLDLGELWYNVGEERLLR